MGSTGKYFIALDLGSTSTRASLIDTEFKIITGSRFEQEYIQNDEGLAEHDPEVFFLNVVKIIRDVAKCDPSEIIGIGIASQRATFTVWDTFTGEAIINLNTWKDQRAFPALDRLNKNFLVKSVKTGAKFMHLLTRLEFFKTASMLKFHNSWLSPRLQYMMKNDAKLKLAIKQKRASLGALDTWLIKKLTMTDVHVSDMSSISGTGIFDPFNVNYSLPLLALFGIPRSILPKVVANNHDFGFVSEKILGAPIKILASTTDQSASMIANCCFDKWSSKITLGTGSFFNINSGKKCRAIVGATPLVFSCLKNGEKFEKIFKIEYPLLTSVEAIKFLKATGICPDEKDMSDLAKSVENSDGVVFVPINFGFVGIKNSTTKAHMTRAVLENIVFSMSQAFFALKSETTYQPKKIRIDGGISQNDFICQQIATLMDVNIERSVDCSELTSIGCALLSAHSCGILKKLEDAEKFYRSDKIFTPDGKDWMNVYNGYQRFLKVMKKYEKL